MAGLIALGLVLLFGAFLAWNAGVLIDTAATQQEEARVREQTARQVEMTYLTDEGCQDCYDPTRHKTILETNFGLTIQSEKYIDAESDQGRELVERYAIKQLPTVLLSAQAAAYASFGNVWTQVGSIEEDGTFIFRKNAALGAVVYRDLTTGETIRPEPSNDE